MREAQGAAKPERHRFTVSETLIARRRLEGVPDRVPEIEEGACSALPLVRREDARLHPQAGRDDRGERLGVAGGGQFQVSLAALEERNPAGILVRSEEGALYHLREPAPQLARRQGRKSVRVAYDGVRLVEGADQVLPGAQVRPRLAAEARVHLREERGGNRDPGNASQVERRRQSGQIGEHSSAHRDDESVPSEAALDQAFAHRLYFHETLALLAHGPCDGTSEAGLSVAEERGPVAGREHALVDAQRRLSGKAG